MPATIGLSMPRMFRCSVAVDDAENEVPPGERGELMIKGPLVMDGYANNPKATQETIRGDGWIDTGDIATVDEDGYATIVDRKQEMILTVRRQRRSGRAGEGAVHARRRGPGGSIGRPDRPRASWPRPYVMLKPGGSAAGS